MLPDQAGRRAVLFQPQLDRADADRRRISQRFDLLRRQRPVMDDQLVEETVRAVGQITDLQPGAGGDSAADRQRGDFHPVLVEPHGDAVVSGGDMRPLALGHGVGHGYGLRHAVDGQAELRPVRCQLHHTLPSSATSVAVPNGSGLSCIHQKAMDSVCSASIRPYR